MKTIRDIILGWLKLKPQQWGRSKEYQEDAERSYREAYRKQRKKKKTTYHEGGR